MPAGRHTTSETGGTHARTHEESYESTKEQLREEFESLPARAREAKVEDVRRALLNRPPQYARDVRGKIIRVLSPLEQIAVDVYGIKV